MSLRVLKPYEKLSFAIALILIVFEALILLINKDLPPQIPLWYSRPWGLSRLGAPNLLYLIPISSLVILLINNTLANISSNSEKLLAKTILRSSIFIIILGFVSLLQILLIAS